MSRSSSASQVPSLLATSENGLLTPTTSPATPSTAVRDEAFRLQHNLVAIQQQFNEFVNARAVLENQLGESQLRNRNYERQTTKMRAEYETVYLQAAAFRQQALDLADGETRLKADIEGLKDSIELLSSQGQQFRKQHEDELAQAENDKHKLLVGLLEERQEKLSQIQANTDRRLLGIEETSNLTILALQGDLEQAQDTKVKLEATAWTDAAELERLRTSLEQAEANGAKDAHRAETFREKLVKSQSEKLRSEEAVQQIITNLRQEISRLNSDKNELSEDIQCALTTIDGLQSEAEAEKQGRLDALVQSNELRDKILILNASHDRSQADISRLQEEKTAFEKQLQATEEDVANLTTELQNQKDRRPSSDIRCEQLEAENLELDENLRAVKAHIGALLQSSTELTSNNELLEADKAVLQAKYDAEFAAHEESLEKLDGATQTNTSLSSTIHRLEQDKTTVENKYDAEYEAHKRTRNKLDLANETIVNLNKRKEELKQEKQKIIDNDAEVVKQVHAALTQQIAEANKIIEKQKQDAEDTEVRFQRANSHLARLRTERRIWDSDLAAARTEMREAETRAASILVEKQKLERDLEEAGSKQDLDEANKKLATAEQKQVNLFKQVQAAKKDLRTANEKTGILEKELATANEKASNLQKDIDAANEKAQKDLAVANDKASNLQIELVLRRQEARVLREEIDERDEEEERRVQERKNKKRARSDSVADDKGRASKSLRIDEKGLAVRRDSAFSTK